jgi:regulatory protein
MAFQRRKRSPDRAPLTTDEALLKLEQFCAFRERSPKEVRERLAELGLGEAAAAELFTVLQNEGFFDEERFACAYVNGKFRSNHWGRVRIRLELRMRDIDPDIIDRALASIGEAEYLELLRHLAERRRQELERRGDDNARDKTAAALIRAGFEHDLVFRETAEIFKPRRY